MHAVPADDPDAPRSGGEEVAGQVDLQAVGRAGRGLVVDVVEDAPVRGTVLAEVVGHPDLLVLVGVGDVENVLVGREGDAVGPRLVADQQVELAVGAQAVDAVEVELAQRRLLQALQAVRRVGEVERPVGTVGGVVRAVEPAPFEAVDQHRPAAVGLDPRDAAVAVLADDEPALGVERQPVRRDRPQPLAVALENGVDERAGPLGLGPLVDGVGPHVGEEQPRLAADPHRPLGEHVALGQLLDGRARRHERVEPRVDPQDAAGPRLLADRRFLGRRLLLRRPAAGHRQGRERGRRRQAGRFHHVVLDSGCRPRAARRSLSCAVGGSVGRDPGRGSAAPAPPPRSRAGPGQGDCNANNAPS